MAPAMSEGRGGGTTEKYYVKKTQVSRRYTLSSAATGFRRVRIRQSPLSLSDFAHRRFRHAACKCRAGDLNIEKRAFSATPMTTTGESGGVV
jgi:hypothetical protein